MSDIKFPITVNQIVYTKHPVHQESRRPKIGQWVSVRPCDEKYEGKTYLGVYVGELAIALGSSFDRESGVLTIGRYMYNPAMLVPDINAVILGIESWWGRIEKPEDLAQITDQDIENIWYVKAMKELMADVEGQCAKPTPDAPPTIDLQTGD